MGFAIFAFIALRPPAPESKAIQTRIYTLDNFVKDVKRDMDRAVFISSFRSLLAIQENIIAEGVYVDNLDAAFGSAAINGSYKLYDMAQVENSTMNVWLSRVSAQASLIGADVNVSFIDMRIAHNSPWSVESQLDAVITVSDRSGLASFTQNHTSRSNFSIIGFEDPVHLLNTFGRIPRIVNQTTYSYFVSGNNTQNLLAHTTNGLYLAHSDAPSWLMRLEGNLNASPYGIESLVNITEHQANLIPIKTKTIVDHRYFGSQLYTDRCILYVPAWFLIDSDHLGTYEVAGITC